MAGFTGIGNFTNDLLFRYVFGAEKNKDVLRSLLNAILSAKRLAPIQRLQILNPFLEISQIGEKKSIADILAKDETGKIYKQEHLKISIFRCLP